MANYLDALIYAQKKGTPELAKDYHVRRQFFEAYDKGQLLDEVSVIADQVGAAPIQKPGDFTRYLAETTKDLFDSANVSALDKLKASSSFDIKSLMKNVEGIDTELDDVAGRLFGGEAEDDSGFIWGSIKRGWENDMGFVKATAGLAADALGWDQVGDYLKASAEANWQKAEEYGQSVEFEKSPIAWAGQLLLEQAPGLLMTLGTGVAAKIAAKSTVGIYAKASIKKELKKAVEKQLYTNGLRGEALEAAVEKAVSKEVLDSVATVGLRDAFIQKGRQDALKLFGKNIKAQGIDVTEDVAKAALSKARMRSVAENLAPSAAVLTYSVGATDGDIIKDMYDQAKELRAAKVEELVGKGMPLEEAAAKAEELIADPTLGDLGIAGFIAPALDALPTFMIGSRFGFFGGGKSKVGEMVKALKADAGGRQVLKNLTSNFAKDTLTEGSTEALQGFASEWTKKNYIDKWKDVITTPEQEMELVQYLTRPEAWTRYAMEFLGGAVMGGVLGTGGQAWENYVTDKEAKRLIELENYPEEVRKVEKAKIQADAEARVAEAKDLPKDPEARVNFIWENLKKDFSEGTKTVIAEAEKIEQERTPKLTEDQQSQLDTIEKKKAELQKKKLTKKFTEEKREQQLAQLDEQVSDIQDKSKADANKTQKLTQANKELREKAAKATDPDVKQAYEDQIKENNTQLVIEMGNDDTLAERDIHLKPVTDILNQIREIEESNVSDEIKARTTEALQVRLKEAASKLSPIDLKQRDQRKTRLTELRSIKAKDRTESDKAEMSFLTLGDDPDAAVNTFETFGTETPKYIFDQITPEQLEENFTPEDIDDAREFYGEPEVAEPEADLAVEEEVDLPIDEAAADLEIQDTPELELPPEGPVFSTTDSRLEELGYEPQEIATLQPDEKAEILATGRTPEVLPEPKKNPTSRFVQEFGVPVGSLRPVAAQAIGQLDRYQKQLEDSSVSGRGRNAVEQSAREAGWQGDGDPVQYLVQKKRENIRQLAQDPEGLQKFQKKTEAPKFARPVGDESVSQGTSVENLEIWLKENAPAFLATADIQVVTSEKFLGSWQGAYSNGVVYLNADTMTESDMKRIVYHEVLGHAVAKQVLGNDYDGVMKTLLSEIKRINAGGKDLDIGGTSVKELIKAYSADLYREDGSLNPEMAEELWAKYIEAHAEGKIKNKNTLFQIYEKIRDWIMDKLGVTTLSNVNRKAAEAVRRAEFNSFDYANLRDGTALARPASDFNVSGTEARIQRPITIYHATIPSNVAKVRQEGLNPRPETQARFGAPSEKGMVYFASDTKDGAYWVDGAESNEGGRGSLFAVTIPEGSNLISQDHELTQQQVDALNQRFSVGPAGTKLRLAVQRVHQSLPTDALGRSEAWSEVLKTLGFDGYFRTDGAVVNEVALVGDNFQPQLKNATEVNEGVKFSRPINKRKPPVDEKALRNEVRIMGIALPKALESIGGEIQALTKKTDINLLDKLFRPKQWIAEKLWKAVPQLRRMFLELTNMSERHHELMNFMSNEARAFIEAEPADRQAVEKVLIQGDIREEEYATAAQAGLTETQFEQYQSVRRALDEAKEIMIVDAQKAVDMLEAKIAGQENIRPMITETIKNLKESIVALNNMKGFFPRVRPQDANWEVVYRKDGKLFSEYIEGKEAAGEVAAKRRAQSMREAGATDVQIRPIDRKIYDSASLNAQEVAEISNIVNSVLTDPKTGAMPPGVDEALRAMFYAKGFKKHYLGRKKLNEKQRTAIPDNAELGEGTTVDPDTGVIHGYQTENLDVVLKEYLEGLARQSSHAEVSERLMNIFEEKNEETGELVFDPQGTEHPGAYDTAKEFLKAASGAGNEYSTAVRRANVLSFHAHIGLRMSSALWNMTHVHMFGSGLLHSEMKKQGMKNIPSFLNLSKQFMGAHKDAMLFVKAKLQKPKSDPNAPVTLTDLGWGQDRAELLDAMNKYFMTANGTTLTEQIYSENFGNDPHSLKGKFSHYAAKYSKISGWFMHHSELANKLASFSMHYENTGKGYDEAKHFVRLLNGSYEKWNMPGYLQGEGLGQAAAQILLNTFRTHVLNTYEIMGSMWKGDKAAFAYSMAAATLMAGVPGKEMFEGLTRLIWGAAGQDDPFQGSLDLTLRESWGEGEAKFIKGGLSSWLDIVDTSNSIGIGAHPVVDAVSYLTGMNREAALAAPFTGFIKAMKGEQPPYKMMPIKGIQSMMQAIYESTEGVEIGKRKIINSDGTEMKLTPWEAALVAVGLNPARRSETSSEIWETRQVQFFFDNWKSRILEDAQEARSPVERMEINKRMREFNNAVRDAKRSQTLRDVVRSRDVSWKDAKRPRSQYEKVYE